MSPAAGKKLKRERLYLLLIIFLLTGCSKPDRWYDIEDIYKNSNPVKENIPIETELLPMPQYQTASPLPEAKDGRIALSLEQAVYFSLKRNRELQVERYTPLIAGTFEQIERGIFDAELFSEIQYSEETASETSRSTEESFGVEGDDVEAATGLRQLFPSGTAVETSIEYGRSTSNRTPDQQEIRLGLSVTQSLLKGFGAAVNLVGVRQAQLETQASLYEFRGFLEALLAEVEISYWRYVLTSEGITIFEQSLEIAKKQLTKWRVRLRLA